jgi:hypothetical protein
MGDRDEYHETLHSHGTEAVFVSLMLVGLLLFLWQRLADGAPWLGALFFVITLFFLFYSLNYRTLTIRLNSTSLVLKFGIFTWVIPLGNIEDVYLDQTHMMRIGGAGIHFTPLGGRYRAFFNFLEYPRVVVVLRQKKGPVKEVAFSTRHPGEIQARLGSYTGNPLPV